MLSDGKTEHICQYLVNKYGSFSNILVVGCGRGIEAAILSQNLNAPVTGIDITEKFNPEAAKYAQLQVGDATALDFPDDSFDFVYCYHALEHISDPVQAVREISRVLKPGGAFWIGTPNRSRILGNIGRDQPLMTKIKRNVKVWHARIKGRFKNEYGQHAGFTEQELLAIINATSLNAKPVSNEYYQLIYKRYQNALKLIKISGLSKIIYPGVYFSGIKKG